MPPALLTRYLDPVLGLFSGVFAYYLYETHPRNTLPQHERLLPLLRWKWRKIHHERHASLNSTQ
ncbi:hypothetical protein BDQ17DRAFT_1341679 [Cyathus striatus]|nr:hypothetical protein BDQ17DRAFT_1341679 [Cyathus striatus]